MTEVKILNNTHFELFFEDLYANIQDLPYEFNEAVDQNFWDLVSDEQTETDIKQRTSK